MKGKAKGLGIYFLIIIVLLALSAMLWSNDGKKDLIYSDVVSYFETEQVKAFVIKDSKLTMQLQDGTIESYNLPSVDLFLYDLGDLIREQRRSGIISDQDYQVSSTSLFAGWISMIPSLLLVVVVGFILFNLYGKGDGGAGKAMSFGKSRAKLMSEDSKKVTFDDVAGADEEKAELEEIVEFLKSPKKFMEIGARIPKGVLLVGPPGTGKTLIARAVAGEAGVPFFTISGSDFVELYVGVGASRVRDLFEQAKKHAPAIIFIDEIDAVGRHRGAGLGGGHDEREQTLNQLLVEMDGFGKNEGVIIIAATNRPDILDPALLRPGRFDRQVYVGVPDIKGREDVLKVHAKNKAFDETVSFKEVAQNTIGFTGADLENLLNEAALLAARREKKKIGKQELDDAFLKVIMGTAKKSRIISEKERKLTAFHEAGHAIVRRLLPSMDEVHQVSIIPRGRAGGFTLSVPKEDRSYSAKSEMFDQIVVFLGGRVAEKVVLDDISTGASNDIERATELARSMVTKYGMSDKLGPISFGTAHEEVFLGKDIGSAKDYSEEIAYEIDKEIKNIIDASYNKCFELITENRDKLDRVAEYLLKYETMDGSVFEKLFNGEAVEEAEVEKSEEKAYREASDNLNSDSMPRETDGNDEKHEDSES